MTEQRRRWGRAGQRLTAEEARVADTRAERRRYDVTMAEQRDYRLWAAGEVVPARITIALDSHALHGPEVDEACGAHEPDVDMWEAGLLMPFVTVRSVGGPHDDDAYAAGWEMGALDRDLASGDIVHEERAIRADSVAQADLIAMRNGYSMTVREHDETWSWATFSYGVQEQP